MAQSGGGLFGFGQNTGTAQTTNPAGTTGFGGGLSFGTQPQQTGAAAPAFSFGNTAAPAGGQTGGGFSFGATAQQPAGQTALGGFGAPASQPAQPVGVNFGATASAPATSTASSLFNFSNPAAGTTLGATGTTSGLGSTAGATGFGSSFAGAGTTGTSGLGSGITLGSSVNPSAPASAPTAAAPAFSFGATAAAPATTTSTPAFSFGTPATSTPTFSTGGFSMPGTIGAATTTTTSAPGTTPSTGFAFGTAPTTAAPTTGFGSVFGSATTTSSTGLNFSQKLTTSTASAPGTTTTSLFGTLGVVGTSTTAAAPTASGTTTLGGLGGIPKYSGSGVESSFAFGSGSGDGKSENRALLELPIPAELNELVECLKNQIKQEKVKSTEVSKANNDVLINKVSEEFEDIKSLVANVANTIQKQSNVCNALKQQFHKGITNAEMAHQTKETPSTLQMEHTAPMGYFFGLVDSYRERMSTFLREIEKAERSLAYVVSSQSTLTSKELFDALKATQESTIALSAKVQILHEEVTRVAEAHSNLQRYLLGESADLKIASNRADKLANLSQLGKDEERRFIQPTLLFPHKIVEPPKMGGFNPAQTFSTPVKTTGSQMPGLGFTSTPMANRMNQPMNKPSESFYYAPHALFQTQQSTLLSSSQLASPGMSPGLSLKRSKN